MEFHGGTGGGVGAAGDGTGYLSDGAVVGGVNVPLGEGAGPVAALLLLLL